MCVSDCVSFVRRIVLLEGPVLCSLDCCVPTSRVLLVRSSITVVSCFSIWYDFLEHFFIILDLCCNLSHSLCNR